MRFDCVFGSKENSSHTHNGLRGNCRSKMYWLIGISIISIPAFGLGSELLLLLLLLLLCLSSYISARYGEGTATGTGTGSGIDNPEIKSCKCPKAKRIIDRNAAKQTNGAKKQSVTRGNHLARQIPSKDFPFFRDFPGKARDKRGECRRTS